MIRIKKRPKIRNLKKVFPKFFWRECYMCNREFKKQYGWRFDTFDWGDKIHSYICNECAKTEFQAIKIVTDINKYSNHTRIKPTSAPVPPAPPKQIKRRV